MTGPSELIRLVSQMRPVRMHRQEPRVRLNECAEPECGLSLSQFASHGQPKPALVCGSVWHRSGEAA